MKLKRDPHKYRHPFHLVTLSPWPFLTSMNIFTLVIGFVMYMHFFQFGGALAILGFLGVLVSVYGWWSDVIFEATYQSAHTFRVQRGLRYGFVLFIASEVMFFFGFFFAFFYVSLSPSVQIGAIWPPLGIEVLDPWSIPFLNTIILLLSGVYATAAHHILKFFGLSETNPVSIVLNPKAINTKLLQYKTLYSYSFSCLLSAIFLGITFTLFQLFEYLVAPFSMADGIYGSIFYMATGFHGLHVLIGTIFLIVVFFRHKLNHFIGRHYFAVEAAVWYWHFVDVVWLFLFVSIYWWGS
jgi:heme/copper-type cytochrome/quinol oxidase subunit 3